MECSSTYFETIEFYWFVFQLLFKYTTGFNIYLITELVLYFKTYMRMLSKLNKDVCVC